VTLTTYEMEWTVRYFLNMQEKWVIKSVIDTGKNTVTGISINEAGAGSRGMTLGSMAYWNRKKAVWKDLVKKADSIFRFSNPAYQSPL